MTYMACVRARLARCVHARDNVVSGEIEIAGELYSFQTRSHIAAAVNRNYRGVNWKPSDGDEVLIDGDLVKGHFTVDHIEAWQPDAYQPLERHAELVARLDDAVGAMPEMSKLLRHRLSVDGEHCLRWNEPADASLGRRSEPAILSAIFVDWDCRFLARTRKEGRIVPLEQVSILPLLAQTLGIPTAHVAGQQTSEPRIKIGRPPAPARRGRKVICSSNPNKWIPGQPYRPEGMPEPPQDALGEPPFSDCPF